jgi:mono/diheme cytochrome c family protein
MRTGAPNAKIEHMNRVTPLIVALGVIALAGCRPGPNPLPISQLDAQQSRGRSVFIARCSLCHYDRQYGDLHGPSLASLYKKPALPSGAAATDERVIATIVHGRNNMPAQGGQIDPSEMSDLIAYLHTL